MTKGKDKEFTTRELDYLRGLPAVERATPLRIVYTEEFKRACLSRYLMGDSPVRMFREAGLGPELVGYKRIERCFSRWRADSERILGGAQTGSGPDSGTTWTADTRRLAKTLRGGVADFADPKDPEWADTVTPDAPGVSDVRGIAGTDGIPGTGVRAGHVHAGPDARDLLIARLNLRVAELEREVAELRRQLENASADSTDDLSHQG